LRSNFLPKVGDADLSDSPPTERSVPWGWPHTISPHFSDWAKGDIVLIESSGSLKDLGIVARQAVSRNRATRVGRTWVHAALYAGGGEIIDITLTLGAATRSLWVYCKDHDITVRRVPNLTDAQRDSTVDVASRLVARGVPYSKWQLIVSTLVPNTVPVPDELYCSTFVGYAFDAGCQIQLHAQSMYRPLYPGTLAEHQALDKVDLEWRPIF